MSARTPISSARMGLPYPVVVCCLSSAASLGVVRVGMRRSPCNAGIILGRLVGASVDAINVAFIAAEPSPGQLDVIKAGWPLLTACSAFPSLGPRGPLRWRRGQGTMASYAGVDRIVRGHLVKERDTQATSEE